MNINDYWLAVNLLMIFVVIVLGLLENGFVPVNKGLALVRGASLRGVLDLVREGFMHMIFPDITVSSVLVPFKAKHFGTWVVS